MVSHTSRVFVALMLRRTSCSRLRKSESPSSSTRDSKQTTRFFATRGDFVCCVMSPSHTTTSRFEISPPRVKFADVMMARVLIVVPD